MSVTYPDTSMKWMKIFLLIAVLVVLVAIAFLIVELGLFQPADNTQATLLPAFSNTRVNFAPGEDRRLYRFNAHPTDFTLLRLDSETPGFVFAAEIQNQDGEIVGLFNGVLENVQIDLPPDDGLYQVAVVSVDPERSGTVTLSVTSVQLHEVSAAPIYNPVVAPPCSIINTTPADVLVRSAPSDNFAMLGTLPPATTLPALGRTDDGWFAVNFAERQGWLRADVAAPQGDCAALPSILNPTIPSAPEDVAAYAIEIDRDGEGLFREVISYPQGDTNDLLWVSIINLHTEPPNNYREFTLTLNCEGSGLEAVRWGLAYAPNMTCGQSVVMPFINGANQQPFSITLPQGSRQSYVQFSLSVTPAGSVG